MKFFLTSSKKKENGNLSKERLEITQQYSYTFSPNYSKIRSRKAKEKLEKLKNFSYPPDAKLRLKEKFPFNEMDEEEINMCIDEFKKYIGLVVIRQYEKNRFYNDKYARVAMASDIIDEVWHNLILFSNYYTHFSLVLFGEYLHHTPSTASSPITDDDIKRFVVAYREYFGSINPLWYYKINKNIKINSKENIGKSNTPDDIIDKRPVRISNSGEKSSSNMHLENKLSRIEEIAVIHYLTMNSIIYSIDTSLLYYIPEDVFAHSESDGGGVDGSGGGDGGGGCGGCGGCG